MPALAELKEELNEMTTLKFISAAFAEAAASKIGKIRDAFFHNVQYFDEISQLYHIVKVSSEVKKKKRIERGKTVEQSDEKTALVAVTSNHRFFGPLNINTMQAFIQAMEKSNDTLYVIGQTGADYLHMAGVTKKYELIRFDKDFPTPEETKTFLESLAQFSKVLLYYPKFKTMLSQVVEMVDITHTPEAKEIEEEDIIRYLFEPELSTILTFFESEVRSILFTRAMLEAELSRTAARLMSMSAAEEKADELMFEKRVEIGKLRGSIANMQLLETFSGMQKWKRT